MAFDIDFNNDNFNVDFSDASDKFNVTFNDTHEFNVEFTDDSGDTFAVEFLDSLPFNVVFEQDSFSVVIEDADTFSVDFQDNTFDVVFDEDSFDVVFNTMGIQGTPGVDSVLILAEDPVSPSEGEFWFNTTSKLLKVFDGTKVDVVSVFSGDYDDLTDKPITITQVQADAIVANTNKVGITQVQTDAIVANTNKVGITTTQAEAIALNTNKIGITTAQAAEITTNTLKVGITTAQANEIAANNLKVGITTAQAGAIASNTLKVGITTSQAEEIAANTLKTADSFNVPDDLNIDGTTLALRRGTTVIDSVELPESGSGVEVLAEDPTGADLTEGLVWYNSTADVVRYYDGTEVKTISVGASSFSGAYSDLTGKPTTITTAQAEAIVANTTKVSSIFIPFDSTKVYNDGESVSFNNRLWISNSGDLSISFSQTFDEFIALFGSFTTGENIRHLNGFFTSRVDNNTTAPTAFTTTAEWTFIGSYEPRLGGTVGFWVEYVTSDQLPVVPTDAIEANTAKVTNETTWSDYAYGGLFDSVITEVNGTTTIKLQFGGTDSFVYRNVVETPSYTDIIYSDTALTTVLATRGG